MIHFSGLSATAGHPCFSKSSQKGKVTTHFSPPPFPGTPTESVSEDDPLLWAIRTTTPLLRATPTGYSPAAGLLCSSRTPLFQQQQDSLVPAGPPHGLPPPPGAPQACGVIGFLVATSLQLPSSTTTRVPGPPLCALESVTIVKTSRSSR